jgi:hypothetical protein
MALTFNGWIRIQKENGFTLTVLSVGTVSVSMETLSAYCFIKKRKGK